MIGKASPSKFVVKILLLMSGSVFFLFKQLEFCRRKFEQTKRNAVSLGVSRKELYFLTQNFIHFNI